MPIEVAAFSGQGIPSGQLAELRRVAKRPEVHSFLRVITNHLSSILSTLSAAERAAHYPCGLDVAGWATMKPSECPSLEYLNSAAVTLVLTLTIQLACFRFVWARGKSFPATAAMGHSQGLAAAIVVALSTCERDYEEHACAFATVLLQLGLAIAKEVPAAHSYALAVMKLPAADLEALIKLHKAPVRLVVRNGARASTLAGTPAALTAFQETALDTCAQPVACKRLPVPAPFHCEELLGSASEICMQRLAGEAPVHVEALRRPCWSCVDGVDLSGHVRGEGEAVGRLGGDSLQAYLVHALVRWAVDWPSAVRAVRRAGGRLVDFGPGGGSGVARMSTVVAQEEEGDECCTRADGLPFAEYFTQAYGVPGPLPQSWLAWIKSEEVEAEAEGAAAVSPPAVVAKAVASSAAVGAVAGKRAGYFSDRLKSASGGAATIHFAPAVLAAIEREVSLVREGRRQAMARVYPAPMTALMRGGGFTALRREATLTFDRAVHPLRERFASLLGLPSDLPLERLHEYFHADRGSKRDRREKLALLRPLTDASRRASFWSAYEGLVLELLAPRVRAAMGCDRLLFQSFPCVRVHRPGEFSIGPHCDAQYQAPDGNLNYYLPLTAIGGTNSLYLESEPGAEDWHPLELSYGELQTFYGVYCAHFTAENTTGTTRASLDFRLVPGGCYETRADCQPVDFKVGGYYSEAAWGEPAGRWEVSVRGQPYWRHGFPHTNR